MRPIALVALAVGFAGFSALSQAQVPTTDTADAVAPSAAVVAPKAVVELFTSQGCSSCPNADALLARLGKRNDIITLSFSVDYWDYLGWKDTLARPKFSARQREYSKTRGDGAIYTPQVVVSGLAHVNGSDEGQIKHLIDKTARTLAPSRVAIKLSDNDNKLVVDAGAAPAGAPAKDATLWLAVIARSVSVPIERGENQGKTITYNNVVQELIPIGTWSGKPMTVQLDRHTFMQPSSDGCAVLLQQGHAGPIIGAALLRQY
jgi:hypothetical protein